MSPIKNISDIDTTSNHGRMLVAAITMISSESLIPKSYDEVIASINELKNHMYGEVTPTPQPAY